MEFPGVVTGFGSIDQAILRVLEHIELSQVGFLLGKIGDLYPLLSLLARVGATDKLRF